jgi:hypothetical protein
MDCRGDQKGSLTERELRFLEKVEWIMLPFFLRDLGQIKKGIPALSVVVQGDGELIPLDNDSFV